MVCCNNMDDGPKVPIVRYISSTYEVFYLVLFPFSFLFWVLWLLAPGVFDQSPVEFVDIDMISET